MELRSPDFENGALIPSRYTCDGEDINPELEIHDVPPGTDSLALIVDDPDAPEQVWTHWTVWNIGPETERIAAGTAPIDSIEGMTSFNRTGWGGPCPPSGTHRYFFKLFALDKKIDLTSSAKVEDLIDAMENHIISRSELVGLYTRPED